VLCAVGGVQAQSITIDRQMRRYHVPRLAFINKMDRIGADPLKVVRQLRQRLGCDAVLLQLPIGHEADFAGVIDLVAMEAVYFDGPHGEVVRREPIPAPRADEAQHARQQMLEALSMYSDEILERLLAEEPVPEELIHQVIHAAVVSQQVTPVLLGSAYRNKGVQPLLDAVVRYLPCPSECEPEALAHDDPQRRIRLAADSNQPTVAMAFKIVADPYGTLAFMRIYQGRFVKGESYYNQRTGRKERFGRIVRMHADQREEIDAASAGEIVAVVGLDCISGDTYASEYPYCTLQKMHVPEPVIRMAIEPVDREGAGRLAKALHRFAREDPTLQVAIDEQSGQTILAGMGELHLEVYAERIRREFQLDVQIGAPKVNYRETPTQPAEFNVRHKKQSGGAGQYAHLVGRLEPLPADTEPTFVFEEHLVGGRVPREFLPAIEKGFRKELARGPLAHYPVVGLKVVLLDGSYHEVDSSDLAFQICAQTVMRETFLKTRPVLLEPIMKVDLLVPSEFMGEVLGDLHARGGKIEGIENRIVIQAITAFVPLRRTFGYSTALRSLTQGRGTFSMQFSHFDRAERSA